MSLNKRFQTLINTPFFRNIFKLSFSSVFTMLLSLLVTPVLSRLFTPEDYGEWGVFSSVSLIVGSMIFLSYENAIVKSRDNRELTGLIILCFIVSLSIISLVALVFIVGVFLEISFFVQFPSITLLLLALFLDSLKVLFSFLANRFSKYNNLAISGVVLGGTQAVSRFALGFCHVRFGLIIGNIGAIFVNVFYLVCNLKDIFKTNLTSVKMREIIDVAIKHKKFPLFDAPARLISFIVGNIVIIILSFYFKMDEIGCFSMVSQLVLIPISLIGSSMSTVYFKDLSVAHDNKDEIKKISEKMLKLSFPISLLPTLFLVLGGDYLLTVFLGAKWENVGNMALCLSFLSIPVVLSEPLLPIFKVLEKQDLLFNLNLLILVLSIGSLYIGICLSSNVLFVLVCYSLACGLSRFIFFYYQLKLSGMSVWQFRKQFFFFLVVIFVLTIRILNIFFD